MRFSLLPKSHEGKRSVSLGIAFIVLIYIKIQYPLPVPSFFIAFLGLAVFVTGVRATIKNKDNAILIFLPILVGLVVILWIIAEIISPH